MFGFIGNIISSGVKLALTPVVIVKDTIDVVLGEDPENTKKLIKSAGKDVENALDEIMP